MKQAARKRTHWGQHIRALRQARGLTLRAVATAARIDPGNLSRVEQGKADLSRKSAARLVQALDIPHHRLDPNCPSDEAMDAAHAFDSLNAETRQHLLGHINEALRRGVAMRISTCESCRFYDRLKFSKEEGGLCRRHPPAPVFRDDEGLDWHWPEVYEGDWCGEHEAK